MPKCPHYFPEKKKKSNKIDMRKNQKRKSPQKTTNIGWFVGARWETRLDVFKRNSSLSKIFTLKFQRTVKLSLETKLLTSSIIPKFPVNLQLFYGK